MTRTEFIASLAAIPFIGKLFKKPTKDIVTLDFSQPGEVTYTATPTLNGPFEVYDRFEADGVTFQIKTDMTGTYLSKFVNGKLEPYQQVSGPSNLRPFTTTSTLSSDYHL